jgi:transposase InsO family protein
MNHLKSEVLRQAARELAEAPHGDKTTIVDKAAALLGLSRQRTYSLIKDAAAGIDTAKRKRRADANTTAITDAELLQVAGVLAEGRRANGKAMWSIERAIDVLHADGKLAVRLSPSRVSTLMRERGMHPDQINAPSPASRMRSENPNAVWQADASVCVLYRTPKGEVALMEREAFYKNKLHNVAKVMNDLVVRYVGSDHCSGAIGVRFYTGGETAENALEHLIWLMQQRTGPDGHAAPFYGVPHMLYTDQGSAFKSGPFMNFCDQLDIKLQHHKPRNSRATGQVENSQNIVERGLEGTLRFLDPETITMASLNALADVWMHWFNGTRKHTRHGMTRYSAWSMITAEQLRMPPNEELLRALPSSAPEQRRVSNDMLVSFAVKGYGSHDYDVRYVRGAAPGEKLLVAVNPFEAPAVKVASVDQDTGELVWQTVQPLVRDQFGFDAGAPILGQSYRAMPLTAIDENRNAIARQAYATEAGPATLEEADKARRSKAAPYLGQFDPTADLKAAQVPAYIPRRGTEHPLQARQAEVPRLTVVEACKRLKALLGEQYSPKVYAWVNQRFAAEGLQLVQPLRAAGGDK